MRCADTFFVCLLFTPPTSAGDNRWPGRLALRARNPGSLIIQKDDRRLSPEELNHEFGIAGVVTFAEGEGGMPRLRVDNRAARAEISLHGGQVLAYRPLAASHALLFLSERAWFRPDKAIKGGIPVCWPWFGDDPEGRGRPAHGFARIAEWSVLRTAQLAPGHTRVVLGLEDDAATRALWPHAFRLTLTLDIADTLALSLATTNTGDKPFRITQALHTYFAVGAIDAVSVNGLDGCRYLDKVRGFAEGRQTGPVTFAAEVDRIYQGVERDLSINDTSLGRSILIRPGNSTTAVAWNPWAEISTAAQDLADDAYRRFVCVETANAGDEIVNIAPGAEYALSVSYRVSS